MKNHPSDLAILGGKPAFDDKLHVGRPNIGSRDLFLQRVNDILDRRWLTNDGPYVRELERCIEELTGVRHCVAMCNGTIALEIAIRATGLKGEVIVPSFTFVATAHALDWLGITPVFCDVAPGTYHIDPVEAEKLITERTSGIMPVHVWGKASPTEEFAAIAARHNLRLIYDSAHAFACSHHGTMIGHFGNAEIFSFHATKFFNTFEGGAVVTNDDDLAQRVRLMRNFGFAGYDHVVSSGTNGKMSEICAAMGVTLMDSLEETIQTNLRNYKVYQDHLSQLAGIQFVTYDETEKCNFQYIVVEVDESVTGISRDRLTDILHAENIVARRYFYPGCHQMEPYRARYPDPEQTLPQTSQLVQRVLTLPTGTAVQPEDIAQICDIIKLAVAHGPDISRQLDAMPIAAGSQ